MRKAAINSAVVLLLAAGAAPAFAGTAADTPSREFEALKPLVGVWEGTDHAGKKVRATYRLVSGDTVLMEDYTVEGENTNMVTMYHPDGNRLILTHYCMANNQPRLVGKLTGQNPTTITFTFLDATNVKSPKDGHVHGAVLKLVDNQTLTEEWTFRKDGKDSEKEVFNYKRVK